MVKVTLWVVSFRITETGDGIKGGTVWLIRNNNEITINQKSTTLKI